MAEMAWIWSNPFCLVKNKTPWRDGLLLHAWVEVFREMVHLSVARR